MTENVEGFLQKSGLAKKDHQYLNRPEFRREISDAERQIKLSELRAQYAHDPLALEQIDIYDVTSPFCIMHHERAEALSAANKLSGKIIAAKNPSENPKLLDERERLWARANELRHQIREKYPLTQTPKK